MPKAGKMPQNPVLSPLWSTSDGQLVRLYHGDATNVAERLPARSVHVIVTSPPYWSLRKYDTHENKHLEIGREETVDEYVRGLVAMCGALKRVLRDDGTFWLNLGDCYLPDGNMACVPWRVVLLLQEAGWFVRGDLPWVKRSCMPEPAQNRPSKALEYVFMLTKTGGSYYFDMEAVRADGKGRSFRNGDLWYQSVGEPWGAVGLGEELVGLDVTTQPYEGAHFATFPPKLIEPLIMASTSAAGCCSHCGAPYGRVTERVQIKRERPNEYTKRRPGQEGTGNSIGNDVAGVEVVTKGWQKSCACSGAEIVPATVLDPFVGSGTTCCVSLANNRRSIGIDLSKQYLITNAIPRIEGALMERPGLCHLIGRQHERVEF